MFACMYVHSGAQVYAFTLCRASLPCYKHTNKCVHTHPPIRTSVYTHISYLPIAFAYDTHLKIVTSLALDLERRLFTPFSVPFPAVPHVFHCERIHGSIASRSKKGLVVVFYRLPLVAMSEIKVMTSTREWERASESAYTLNLADKVAAKTTFVLNVLAKGLQSQFVKIVCTCISNVLILLQLLSISISLRI